MVYADAVLREIIQIETEPDTIGQTNLINFHKRVTNAIKKHYPIGVQQCLPTFLVFCLLQCDIFPAANLSKRKHHHTHMNAHLRTHTHTFAYTRRTHATFPYDTGSPS